VTDLKILPKVLIPLRKLMVRRNLRALTGFVKIWQPWF
jgi:hypothetical protein